MITCNAISENNSFLFKDLSVDSSRRRCILANTGNTWLTFFRASRFISIQRRTSIRQKISDFYRRCAFAIAFQRWIKFLRDSGSPFFFFPPICSWQRVGCNAVVSRSFFSTSRWYNPEVTITCITWLCTSVVGIRGNWNPQRRRQAVFAISPISRLFNVIQSPLSGVWAPRYATWHI